jgi:hypothetical protein
MEVRQDAIRVFSGRCGSPDGLRGAWNQAGPVHLLRDLENRPTLTIAGFGMMPGIRRR